MFAVFLHLAIRHGDHALSGFNRMLVSVRKRKRLPYSTYKPGTGAANALAIFRLSDASAPRTAPPQELAGDAASERHSRCVAQFSGRGALAARPKRLVRDGSEEEWTSDYEVRTQARMHLTAEKS